MAVLTVQNIVNAGTKPTFTAPSLTDSASIGSGDDTILIYKNTDANVKTITIAVPGTTSYGVNNPPAVVTVAITNGEAWIPLRKAFDDGTGNAVITISGTGGVTGLTAALIRHQ